MISSILGGVGMIGSILGGLIGKGGADAAAGGIRNAGQQAFNTGQQALAASQHQQEVNTSEFSPFTNLGKSAVGEIARILGFGKMYGEGGNGGQYRFDPTNAAADQADAFGGFQTSPGYQFRLGEGIKALDRSAAAKGALLSGAQAKGVQAFGQGIASDEYNNWLNNYWKAAGVGQDATRDVSNLNSGLTTAGGNLALGGASGMLNAAQGAGQAQMAGANALASGIGSGINNLLLGSYLFGGGKLFGGGGSAYGSQYGNVGRPGMFGANWP